MAPLVVARPPDSRTAILGAATRRTLAYADLFGYPLTTAELHRYLHGERVSPGELRVLVEDGLEGVAGHDGFYTLAGRLTHVAERRRRQVDSAPLIRRARLYAVLLKHLPFVRMVGLTGSLAMHNAGDGPARDIDLMVITAPGRVWLCRAAVIAAVHLAKLAGDRLCPNYVVSEQALALDDASIYSAHELAQMVPLYGGTAYRRLWAANPQVYAHLPNAQPYPLPSDRLLPGGALVKRLAERLLGGFLGDRLEAWERGRKTRRLRRLQQPGAPEVVFSPLQCKGHFGRHRAWVLTAYHARIAALEGAPMVFPSTTTADHAHP